MPEEEAVDPTPPPSMQPQPLTREQRLDQMKTQQMAGLNEMLMGTQIDLQMANEEIGKLRQQLAERDETINGLQAVVASFQGDEPADPPQLQESSAEVPNSNGTSPVKATAAKD